MPSYERLDTNHPQSGPENIPSDLEKQPDHYALHASKLTYEVCDDIVGIYLSTVYGEVKPDQRRISVSPEQVLQNIASGFRLGSRFSPHSKLTVVGEGVDLVGFDFQVNSDNPNHNEPATLAGKEVAAARETFRGAVDSYFQTQGIAVPIYQ